MIAIVCGGREYADADRIRKVLDAAVDRLGLHTIIEGGANGADKLAREWAEARGDISWIEMPADWDKLGKGAGHARNAEMLTVLKGGIRDQRRAVFAFPGGAGTAHMVASARNSGIEVFEIK